MFITEAKHNGKVFGIGGREARTFWIPGKCLGRGGGEDDGEQAGRVVSLSNYIVVGNCGRVPCFPGPSQLPQETLITDLQPPVICGTVLNHWFSLALNHSSGLIEKESKILL